MSEIVKISEISSLKLKGGEKFYMCVPTDLLRAVLDEWLHRAYSCNLETRNAKHPGYKVLITTDELFVASIIQWFGHDVEVAVEVKR